MRNVVVGRPRKSGRASVATRGAILIFDIEVESAHESSPRHPRGSQQIANVCSTHLGLVASWVGADVPDRVRIADQSERAIGTAVHLVARPVQGLRFAIGLARNQVHYAWA